MKREPFSPVQAQQVAAAFAQHAVEYLFLGKSGAILLGYPGTTQDVDVYPARTPENGKRIIKALRKIGFTINAALAREIRAGRDFIQIKSGPFDLHPVHATDGITSL